MLEAEPLNTLIKNSQLNAYKHNGFWKAMDTLRDNHDLNKLWDNNIAPWKV